MALLYIFKAGIFRIFTDTAVVIESGMNLTDIIALTLPLMAIFQVMSGFFIGTKHTVMAMLGDVVRLWVLRLPMIALFKYAFHMDEYAIWWPLLISNILIDIMFLIMYLSKRWLRPVKR
jgi:Na+-driven multidrug efflux pump